MRMNKVVDEEWRDIVGYEDYYMVSNIGRVKSKDRIRENGKGAYLHKGRILKQTNTSTGYKSVKLCLDGKDKTFKVHRLVAIAFIPNTDNKPFINHIDGNPLNNTLDNLEWVTNRENIIHAIESGLRKTFDVAEDVISDMYINKSMSIKQIADYFKVSRSCIEKVLRKYGISKKTLSEVKNKYNLTNEWVIEQLKHKTAKQLALEVGCDASLISKYKNNKVRSVKNGK